MNTIEMCVSGHKVREGMCAALSPGPSSTNNKQNFLGRKILEEIINF